MKAMRGTWNLSAWRHTVSDCGSTPVDGAEHHHRAVEHAQAALDLDGEVDVAGRVDEVDLVPAPRKGGGGGGDGDAALALLGHPVHLRLAVVDLADLVDAARLEQEPLADGRLAGVDVRDDADVADPGDFRWSCHSEGGGVYVTCLSDHLRDQEIAGLAAREAGAIILRHYAQGSIAVETKSDFSPVTAADRDANSAILARLRAACPDDAVLSEETPDDLTRLAARRVWIVDPLDGTRDFVARTGEFCVHVALVVDGRPVVGAVFHPLAATLYTAAAGAGAFAEDQHGTRRALRVSDLTDPAALRVGVSRTNAAGSLKQLLAETGLAARSVSMGASVKLMALAQGDLDAVLNLTGSEQEWDTCAPEVVIREAGGVVTDASGSPFTYNQRDVSHHHGSISSNGACHEVLRRLVRPYLPPTA